MRGFLQNLGIPGPHLPPPALQGGFWDKILDFSGGTGNSMGSQEGEQELGPALGSHRRDVALVEEATSVPAMFQYSSRLQFKSCLFVLLVFLCLWVLLDYRMALKFHDFLSLSCPKPLIFVLLIHTCAQPHTQHLFLSAKPLSFTEVSKPLPSTSQRADSLNNTIAGGKKWINSLYKAPHGGHVESFEGSMTWIGCKFQRSWGHWKCWFLSQSRSGYC